MTKRDFNTVYYMTQTWVSAAGLTACIGRKEILSGIIVGLLFVWSLWRHVDAYSKLEK